MDTMDISPASCLNCRRCKALCLSSPVYDFHEGWIDQWRCPACGEVVDPQIELNRRGEGPALQLDCGKKRTASVPLGITMVKKKPEDKKQVPRCRACQRILPKTTRGKQARFCKRKACHKKQRKLWEASWGMHKEQFPWSKTGINFKRSAKGDG